MATFRWAMGYLSDGTPYQLQPELNLNFQSIPSNLSISDRGFPEYLLFKTQPTGI